MKIHHLVFASTFGAALLAAFSQPIYSQQNDAAADGDGNASGEKIDLARWDQKALYDGWSADALIDLPVRDQNGEEFGEVHNIIVNADGRIDKIVVEAGGFLDIGDTHLGVAWDKVTLGPQGEYVSVEIDADRIDDFSLFNNDENVPAGPRAWRVTELMDDFVQLEDTPSSYAIVDDLIFDNDGRLQAVLVIPDIGMRRPGRYAYPYYGYRYGYDPGSADYRLPYSQDEISQLAPFDYEALRENDFAAMQQEKTDVAQ